jgi:hypothetical protein
MSEKASSRVCNDAREDVLASLQSRNPACFSKGRVVSAK